MVVPDLAEPMAKKKMGRPGSGLDTINTRLPRDLAEMVADVSRDQKLSQAELLDGLLRELVTKLYREMIARKNQELLQAEPGTAKG